MTHESFSRNEANHLNHSITQDPDVIPEHHGFNVYGQRYHPYGSPYDYQYIGSQLHAGVYTSIHGVGGHQYQPKISYEEKY
jgi:hypothetical protein